MGTNNTIEERVESLDTETKIGQLFIYVQSGTPAEAGATDRSFLRSFRPGGVIVYDRNVASRDQIGGYLADLQGLNAELGLPGPMIVCVDHRGGDHAILEPDAGGLEFPAPIAQTAVRGDLEAVGEEIGAAIARDVRGVGFNLNLAPYADFLERGDIEEFVFGNSMMGADHERNAALAAGLTRGMRGEGLGSTYCVFPGGYGSLDRDPHHFAGVVEADEAEIRERFLEAPRASFAAGAEAVMLSHFQFPALDHESRPGTYSPPVIEDLLREDLGFDGLVMTDAIKMGGATDHAGGSGEAAVRAIEAGADAILCSDWTERDAVADAVGEGRISEERLNEAVGRVLALKESLAGTGGRAGRSAPDPTDQGRMADLVARSLTWAERPDDWTPPGAEATVAAGWRAFLDAASVAGEGVRTVEIPDTTHINEVTVEDVVALLSRHADDSDHLVVGTATEADLAVAESLHRDGRAVTAVHAGRVFLVESLDRVPPLLLSYSHQPIACRRALAAVFGFESAPGDAPVPLDR